ncbi:MAG: ABC-2 type transport system ATP-binding protein [Myxococcota bacterium]|jgi:ABC-2 type transport system ATP-binding protein
MTENILEIKNVAKRFSLIELERLMELKPNKVFRRITAVHDVSLNVTAGQVYGFLGPNGAGKTTTIKMCMDLIRPSSGEITLFGSVPRDPAVKRRVGYLPEHPYFYDYLKPQEILDHFGRIFGLDRGERKKRIDRLLSRVGLDHARNRPLRKFSKGMLQRLGVAQALINDPDLLVFDEPLSGLDPMGRKDIRDILVEERSKGKTIFFCSHILSDIEHVCDRVAIIVDGRIVKEGMLENLLEGEKRESEMVVRNAPAALVSSLKESATTFTDLGGAYKVVIDTDRISTVIRAVLDGGGQVDRLQPHRDSLEELFVREAEQAA